MNNLNFDVKVSDPSYIIIIFFIEYFAWKVIDLNL